MNGTTNVVLLGSTGSIGTQALDVIASHRDRYRVVALAAGRNEELLSQQAAAFDVPPDRVHLGVDTPDALAALAALPEADVVLNAVVGFAGLPATLAALTHGKRLALANKESLIAGGPVVVPGAYNGRNRTFFFGSYEGLRWVRGMVSSGTVPTLLQRAGDFSADRHAPGDLSPAAFCWGGDRERRPAAGASARSCPG